MKKENFFMTGNMSDDMKKQSENLLIHIFQDILPQYGMSYRKEQLKVSLAILEALQENKVKLCEAGVGTGKTHAYMIAVIIHNLYSGQKLPTIISTSTIALQKALTEEYIPQISSILMEQGILERPLSFIARKGKSHYACDSRVTDYTMSLMHNNNPQDRDIIILLRELITGARFIDLDNIPVSDYVKERICVGRCHVNCGFSSGCQYRRYTRRCRICTYDFHIANHNFVLADTLNLKNGKSRLLPAYRIIIFDEAHKILEAARQMYGVSLEEKELDRLAVSIYRMAGSQNQEKRNIRNLCDDMIYQKNILFQEICKGNKERYENGSFAVSYTEKSIQALNALTKILQRLSVLFFTADKAKQNAYERLVSRIEEKLDKVSALKKKDGLIVCAEPTAAGLKLSGIPKLLEEELKKDLWNQEITCILTSATMSIGGNFNHFMRKNGIPQGIRSMEGISVPSPFDYANHCLLYIPKQMPFPDYRDTKYLEAVVWQIGELINQTHGHTLILFTSYHVMERTFYEITKQVKQFPLFLMKRGKFSVLTEFRNSKNGVLFASDSAGEGIDLAGDILSSVIIVKLPFPVPDAMSEQECMRYGSRRQYQKEEVIPAMLIKLRQWVGRGVRKEEDTTVFSILDSRVSESGRYRSAVLAVLPKMPVTDQLEDVGRFIREKKSADYFE